MRFDLSRAVHFFPFALAVALLVGVAALVPCVADADELQAGKADLNASPAMQEEKEIVVNVDGGFPGFIDEQFVGDFMFIEIVDTTLLGIVCGMLGFLIFINRRSV